MVYVSSECMGLMRKNGCSWAVGFGFVPLLIRPLLLPLKCRQVLLVSLSSLSFSLECIWICSLFRCFVLAVPLILAIQSNMTTEIITTQVPVRSSSACPSLRSGREMARLPNTLRQRGLSPRLTNRGKRTKTLLTICHIHLKFILTQAQLAFSPGPHPQHSLRSPRIVVSAKAWPRPRGSDFRISYKQHWWMHWKLIHHLFGSHSETLRSSEQCWTLSSEHRLLDGWGQPHGTSQVHHSPAQSMLQHK